MRNGYGDVHCSAGPLRTAADPGTEKAGLTKRYKKRRRSAEGAPPLFPLGCACKRGRFVVCWLHCERRRGRGPGE